MSLTSLSLSSRNTSLFLSWCKTLSQSVVSFSPSLQALYKKSFTNLRIENLRCVGQRNEKDVWEQKRCVGKRVKMNGSNEINDFLFISKMMFSLDSSWNLKWLVEMNWVIYFKVLLLADMKYKQNIISDIKKT